MREDFDACPATLYLASRPSRGSAKNFQRAHPPAAQQAHHTQIYNILYFFVFCFCCYFCCPVCVCVLIIALLEEEFYFTHAMHSGMPSLCLRPPPRMSLNCINNALTLSRAKAMQPANTCMPTIKLFHCPVCPMPHCIVFVRLSALMRAFQGRGVDSTLNGYMLLKA